MNFFSRALLVLVISIAVFSEAHAQAFTMNALTRAKRDELVQIGKVAYENRCSGCHGLKGDGNGNSARLLSPKPRDFTKGVFKFKSSPSGTLPSDEDLLKTLNQGILGTSMPSFALVNENEKRAIIEYIKTFSPDSWQEKKFDQQAAQLPPMPQGVFTKKDELIKAAKRGQAWFTVLECITCHGPTGVGDGPSAQKGMVDSWQHPIKPADLTKSYIKRGKTIQDIAQSLYFGIDGTPMPANGLVIKDIEVGVPSLNQQPVVWDLAAYVFYLRGLGLGYYKDEIAPLTASGLSPAEIRANLGDDVATFLGM